MPTRRSTVPVGEARQDRPPARRRGVLLVSSATRSGRVRRASTGSATSRPASSERDLGRRAARRAPRSAPSARPGDRLRRRPAARPARRPSCPTRRRPGAGGAWAADRRGRRRWWRSARSCACGQGEGKLGRRTGRAVSATRPSGRTTWRMPRASSSSRRRRSTRASCSRNSSSKARRRRAGSALVHRRRTVDVVERRRAVEEAELLETAGRHRVGEPAGTGRAPRGRSRLIRAEVSSALLGQRVDGEDPAGRGPAPSVALRRRPRLAAPRRSGSPAGGRPGRRRPTRRSNASVPTGSCLARQDWLKKTTCEAAALVGDVDFDPDRAAAGPVRGGPVAAPTRVTRASTDALSPSTSESIGTIRVPST